MVCERPLTYQHSRVAGPTNRQRIWQTPFPANHFYSCLPCLFAFDFQSVSSSALEDAAAFYNWFSQKWISMANETYSRRTHSFWLRDANVLCLFMKKSVLFFSFVEYISCVLFVAPNIIIYYYYFLHYFFSFSFNKWIGKEQNKN